MPSAEVVIREVSGIDELRRASELHDRVIQWADHSAPLVQLVAALDVGAILIAAFDGETIVGFTFAFPGYRNGRRILHSHMLTVDPAYRQMDLGYRLKIAQRERAIASGVAEITWTFDPLRSLNAYLNVGRLGVIAESYKTNYYGDGAGTADARVGTDRIWVRWLLDSERVQARLRPGRSRAPGAELLRDAVPLLRQDETDGSLPLFREGPDSWSAASVSVEIPEEIGVLQREKPAAAAAWRLATREAFLACFARGYSIEDFVPLSRDERPAGAYVLRPPGASVSRREGSS